MENADKNLIKEIQSHLDLSDLMIQLAEESAELAQAASKCARKFIGRNPTPKSFLDVSEALLEEIGDVMTVIATLGIHERCLVPSHDKLQRWVDRLNGKEEC